MKNNKPINRRSFLKSLGIFLVGIVSLPFNKAMTESSNSGIKPKEAKFYTTNNDLAG